MSWGDNISYFFVKIPEQSWNRYNTLLSQDTIPDHFCLHGNFYFYFLEKNPKSS
jgi:hypothetical protein